MNAKINAISICFLLALSVSAFSLSASAQDKMDKMGKMDGMKMGKMKMGKMKMETVVGKKGILHNSDRLSTLATRCSNRAPIKCSMSRRAATTLSC